MPRIHVSLSGQELKYDDPDPKLARFLQRVTDVANDPKAKADELVALIYGRENPILDHTLFPERGAVTKEVLANPVYHVMADLLARKEAQQAGTDLERVAAKYTLPVAEAAQRLVLSEDAVRRAIREKRLPAWVKKEGYFVNPDHLQLLGQVAQRGPIPAGIEPFEFVVGYDAKKQTGMRIKIPAGEFPKDLNEPEYDDACARWRRVAVRCSSPTGLRVFVLEPGPKRAQLEHGGYSVKGKFEVVQKINGNKAAREFWESFKAS